MKLNINYQDRPVFWGIFAPLSLVFSGLLLLQYWIASIEISAHILGHFTDDQKTGVREFYVDLKNQTWALSSILDGIVHDAEIELALAQVDPQEGFFEAQRKKFDNLRSNDSITELNFYRPDRSCVLRFHDPHLSNEELKEFKLQEPDPQHPLELNPNGTLTVNLVKPILKASQTVGYAELKMNMEKIFELRKTTDVAVAFLIRKAKLQSASRDPQMGLDRSPQWNRFSQIAVGYSSWGTLPTPFDKFLENYSFDQPQFNWTDSVLIDHRNWMSHMIPLETSPDNTVGYLMLSHDITPGIKMMEKKDRWGFIFLLSVVGLLVLIYYLSHKTDASINKNKDALMDRERLLDATLNSIGDGVMVCDQEARVTRLNPISEQLTGWSADYVGRPITEVFNIVNEATRLNVENPVFRSIKEGCIVGLANHTVLIGKDGTEVPIADSCAPIIDHHQQIAGAVLVFRDVTKEHHDLLKLEHLNRQLDGLAKEAQASNLAKSEFLANMSHEPKFCKEMA